jgi:hypothetical protein
MAEQETRRSEQETGRIFPSEYNTTERESFQAFFETFLKLFSIDAYKYMMVF